MVELRILHAGRDATVSGYFDDLDGLTAAAADRDGTAPAIYVTLNPVKPELLARAANRAKPRAQETTSNADVACRRWILVDVDPVRPSGISATEAEHAAAIAVAREIAAWLPSIGIAAESVVLIDSGNGGHLWLRCDLPNDAASLDLVRRCLAALGLKFSTAAAKIDLTTCNAARITKLPGTLTKKGDPTADRRHRRSRLLDVPATIIPAPREALEALAALAPQPEATPHAPRLNGARIDVEAFIGRYGLNVAFSAPWNDGTKWVLGTCPFDTSHTNRSALIGQMASGAVFFRCHHNSCAGKGWAELRALCGDTSPAPRVARECPPAETPTQRPALVTVGDVAAEQVEWLWRSYIPLKKLTVLEGDPAAGKTYLALAIAAAVSCGAPLPDPVDGIPRGTRPPRDVLYIGNEDGIGDTLRPRLDRMEACVARVHVLRGIARPDGNEAGVTLSDVDVIGAAIDQTGAALVIVDPLQGFLGANVDLHRANEVRPVLAGLSRLAERRGCAVLIVRHLSKAKAERAAYRGMGSIDITAAARSVLLAGRDPQDPLRRALVQTKMSLTAEGCSLGYVIGADGFTWTGKVDLTAQHLLAADAAPPAPRDEAAEFLRAALRDGRRKAHELYDEAKQAGIAEHTLKRAKKALGVESRKGAFQDVWWWTLPSRVEEGQLDEYGPLRDDAPPEEGHNAEGGHFSQWENVAPFGERGPLRGVPREEGQLSDRGPLREGGDWADDAREEDDDAL